jgi:hypothetical protein
MNVNEIMENKCEKIDYVSHVGGGSGLSGSWLSVRDRGTARLFDIRYRSIERWLEEMYATGKLPARSNAFRGKLGD